MKEKQQRYEALVHAFQADIFRYAFWLTQDRSIAEDIVQETFLRAWRYLDSLKDEKSARSWLITIVRRENARRFEKNRPETLDMDDFSIADDYSFTDAHGQQNEVRYYLARLPTEYREPIVLQILFGFSGDDIAQQLSLNKNTVMTRLFRARNLLRQMFENEQPTVLP